MNKDDRIALADKIAGALPDHDSDHDGPGFADLVVYLRAAERDAIIAALTADSPWRPWSDRANK